MRYVSLFSGIEAATVAWHGLGWTPLAFAEVEPFPSAVLQHHYPHVPNLGDVTKVDWEAFRESVGTVDVVVFGSPCQSFSVAGKRLGLDDPRGNLALYALGVVRTLRPQYFLFENVPGLLSSGGGRDFGAFLGTVGDIGYQCAWRVLDAQWFGVAQRRRRVFVVGCARGWQRAAAVLFDRESLSGHPAPRRETREELTQSVAGSLGGSRNAGGWGHELDGCGAFIPEVHPTLAATGGRSTDLDNKTYIPEVVGTLSDGAHMGGGVTGKTPTPDGYLPSVANPLTARMHKGINTTLDEGQTLIGGSFDVAAVRTSQTSANGHGIAENVAHTLDGAQGQAIAFTQNTRDEVRLQGGDGQVVGMKQQTYVAQGFADVADPIAANQAHTREGSHNFRLSNVAHTARAVRRLTPVECARLQGFPDTYLDIPYRGKPAADGPKYKALGNSFAVPVVRWLGQRIQRVEDALKEQVA